MWGSDVRIGNLKDDGHTVEKGKKHTTNTLRRLLGVDSPRMEYQKQEPIFRSRKIHSQFVSSMNVVCVKLVSHISCSFLNRAFLPSSIGHTAFRAQPERSTRGHISMYPPSAAIPSGISRRDEGRRGSRL